VDLQTYEVGSADAELHLLYSVHRVPAAQPGGGAHLSRKKRLGLKSERFCPHSSELNTLRTGGVF
jgi:hypothetical protein